MSKRRMRSALKRKLDNLLSVDYPTKCETITIPSDIVIFRLFQGKRQKTKVSHSLEWSYHNSPYREGQNNVEKDVAKLEKEFLRRMATIANKRKCNNRG